MNYRHAFHAGNFADLVKHAALLQVLDTLMADPSPVHIIDTHAGRGLYDLAGEEAKRSGEAQAGVSRLAVAQGLPPSLARLRQALVVVNGGSRVSIYPGSPRLIADQMRPGDSYLACELRPEEHDGLVANLAGRMGVQTACADGYRAAWERLPTKGRALILIDPPFERADDYQQIVSTLAKAMAKNAQVQSLVWLPIKDLETFDGFLRDAEDAGLGDLLIVEARMRPLNDPMTMNGCALVLSRAPRELDPALAAICDWVVSTLGDGGQSRVWRTAKC